MGALAHASAPAPARGTRKPKLAVRRDRLLPRIVPAIDQRIMDELDRTNGGHLTWDSSPTFMWLAVQLARRA